MNEDDLKAWISDPQKIKPGTAMPQIPMTAEQLDEMVAYLISLSAEYPPPCAAQI